MPSFSKLSRKWRRHRLTVLRLSSLLLFCMTASFAPQVKVRAVETVTLEILPEETGSSQQEESTSHPQAVRATLYKWRYFARPAHSCASGSAPCQSRFAHAAALPGRLSFADRVLPLRC